MNALRFLILGGILLMIAAACLETDDRETLIEGRVAGNPDSMNRLIVLQDDDVTGPSFSAHVNRHERQAYETVSYFIHLTTDTVITDATGSTVLFRDLGDDDLFSTNQRLSVRLADREDFTVESTELPRYVTYQPRFLPAYEAESVILSSFSAEDLYSYYRPISEGRYQVLILTGQEGDDPPAHQVQEEITARMGARERTDVDVIDAGDFGLEESLKASLPLYVLMNHEGLIVESSDPEALYEALSHDER